MVEVSIRAPKFKSACAFSIENESVGTEMITTRRATGGAAAAPTVALDAACTDPAPGPPTVTRMLATATNPAPSANGRRARILMTEAHYEDARCCRTAA